jgi:hypothetical protein
MIAGSDPHRHVVLTKPSRDGRMFALISLFLNNEITYQLKPYPQYVYEQVTGKILPPNLIAETSETDIAYLHLFADSINIRKRNDDDPLYSNAARPVVGFENRFLISENGDFYSFKYNKVISTSLNADGYVRLSIRFGGSDKRIVNILVARAVATAFIPNPENKPQVNHRNGIKVDNRRTNLEWVTPKENIDHAIKAGLKNAPAGEASGTAKLTNAQVLEIRALFNDPNNQIKYAHLAPVYNVDPETIRNAVCRRTYTNI